LGDVNACSIFFFLRDKDEWQVPKSQLGAHSPVVFRGQDGFMPVAPFSPLLQNNFPYNGEEKKKIAPG
jgi:hypothetical protein